MEDRLLDEINQLKKDMVVSFTKYSLSGEGKQNNEAVLNSILISWFETIHSSEDFHQKYTAFKKLDSLIRSSYLFDITEACMLDSEEREKYARQGVEAYHAVLKEEDYQKLVALCGYQLPGEFGNQDNYFNGTLTQKIDFYRLFLERLDMIDKGLLKRR